MKTISRFVSSILLLTLLAFSHALCQAEQNSGGKGIAAQELPFRLNVAQEETADGPAVKLTFTNESDAAVTIDQDALRSASPSILINEKAGEAEGTKLTRFASSKTYSGHPLTRDQILDNSTRAITVKPHGSFEITLPIGEVIQSARKQAPDQPVTVRFFIPKLILSGQFSKLTNEDLFALKFASNSLTLK
ncbi:MAG TPA: hypothetical protein PLS03_10365 [Terrimicrobiaceae bacterium]|nr:hypothetical protein [Terrimicrobiaceae bacterium]